MPQDVVRAVLGLGANLGNPAEALQQAVDEICSHPAIRGVAVSDIYVTAPVGGPEQPDYLNAVLVVDTSLAPLALLDVAQSAEEHLHRTREVRWGPRTLDVDVVDVAGLESTDPHLTLPHPRAHERAFVLVPWLRIDPKARLTGVDQSVETLASQVSAQAVQIWEGGTLSLPAAPTLEQ